MVFSAVEVGSVHLSRSGLSVTTLLFIHSLALQHSRSRKRYHMVNEWILPEDLPCGAPQDSSSSCERKGTDWTRITYPTSWTAWGLFALRADPRRRLSLAANSWGRVPIAAGEEMQ